MHEKEQLDEKPKGLPFYPQHPRFPDHYPDGTNKDAVILSNAKTVSKPRAISHQLSNGSLLNTHCQGILDIPYELIGEIANHLMENRVDVSNLRLVNSHVAMGAMNTFKNVLVQDRVLYPRYDCLAHFAFLCSAFLGLNRMVRSVTVVGEGLKAHEYGPGWAWEHLLQWEDVECTNKDLEVMYDIDASHAAELRTTNQFIHGGGYRRLLGQIIKDCPNLKVVNVRKLEVSTHKNTPLAWAGSLFHRSTSRSRAGLARGCSKNFPSSARA
jgi:hypothetical protein